MKILGKITIALCGVLLLIFAGDFPDWADVNSPASTHLSPYFIQHTMEDTAVPNIVTSVLADYRGFDTMFETTVILTAGLACFLLLRIPQAGAEHKYYTHLPTGITLRITGSKLPADSRFSGGWIQMGSYDFIIRHTCRLVIPFIQIFAPLRGCPRPSQPRRWIPGRGNSWCCNYSLCNLPEPQACHFRFSEKIAAIFSATGVFLYAGTGALCLILGENFLNYGALSPILEQIV